MLKYLIWQVDLLEATTQRNSLRLCFFKYFLVRYFRQRLEKPISALTFTRLSSLFTFTLSPKCPVLPPILILLLRNSAKLVVLKTLSSTGLEQSMVKAWEILVSVWSFLAILGCLATLAYCVAIDQLILNDYSNNRSHYQNLMRRLSTTLLYALRTIKGRRQNKETTEQPKQEEKIKFTEEEITEMGQYRMRAKSRHFADIFKEKIEDKLKDDYLKKQKSDIREQEQAEEEMEEEQKEPVRMERKSKAQKKQKLRTFRIYKHQELLEKKMEAKRQEKLTKQEDEKQIQQLTNLAKVRMIEQYFPYDYMRRVQKVFHKYDQTQLRDIAFHFTNLMKLRYNEEKVNYDLYPHLSFQKLQEKLPFHRKVEQIYLTSKQKILEEHKEERKVDSEPIEPEIKYSQNIVVSYLLNRAPRTYATAVRALTEIKKMFEGYSPKSFIDFGAGLSSGAVAFTEVFGDTGYVYSVEPAGKMRKLGKYLTNYSKIGHFQSLAELSSQVRQVDIVYCGYVLNEIRPELVTVYLQSLYSKVRNQGFLVLTQYGNPFGARLIHEARRWALTKNIRIAAPCPHQFKCPLASSRHWCHFDQPTGMYPREVFGKLPNDNAIKLEKYSYLIIQKLEDDNQEQAQPTPTQTVEPNKTHGWDRVLFPLIRRGKHFIYTLCTSGGRFEKRITGKSHGEEYKLGRKLRWGDLWRFGKRIPNRYRKERRTGRRLW